MMTMARAAKAAVVLPLCLAALGTAGEVAAPDVDLSDGLSESEAVALALRQSRSVQGLRGLRAVAESRVALARALPDPELRTGGFNMGDGSSPVWSQTYTVALRWSPPRPSDLRLKEALARAGVAEAEADVAVAERDAATEVRLLFNDLVFLEERAKLADQEVQVRERIAAFVAEQAVAGTKTALDESNAAVGLADARSQAAGYRLAHATAMSRLAAALGLPQTGGLRLQYDDRRLAFPLRETGAGSPAVTAGTPELAVWDARCAQAETALRLRRKERYPWLSFVQASREFGGPLVPNAWSVRVGITLPVFQWGRDPARVEKTELEQCRLETAAEKGRAQTEAQTLEARLKAHAADLENFRERIEPAYVRAVAVAEEAVAAGRADATQTLAAQARLLGQRDAFLGRLQDYRQIEIELDRLAGAPTHP